MDAQFVDRILSCADCHGSFIFTAGEQLFFHDKQFKNDPKRCKPCKSRRSGLAAAANGAGPAAVGLSRTETRTECSECGCETTVPFKPTQGRPVLCRQCFQAKGRGGALPVAPLTMVAADAPSAATLSALTAMSVRGDGATLSVEAAIVAVSCMALASAESSVASTADLRSISEMSAGTEMTPELVPTEILAAANAANIPATLMAEVVEA